ncbi:hypothetical protein [Halomonas daqiaonensis]|uniref:hypothetical protein n=1 Tax=Halomonas daqiaonensis TaxID=650850 RepID=UPI001113EFF6|nr:hypothetical protein [Halomonas daqiaonensis]
MNVSVTGHQHPDKRPHELPDRLLKSGSDLSKNKRSVSLAGVPLGGSSAPCEEGVFYVIGWRCQPCEAFRKKPKQKQPLPPIITACNVCPSPAADAYFTDSPGTAQGLREEKWHGDDNARAKRAVQGKAGARLSG